MAEYFPIDVSSLGSYSGSFSGSFQGNGSRLTGITASYLSGSVTSASYAATASYLLGSIASASYSATASYVNPLVQNVIVTGSIYIPDSTNSIYFSGSGAASRLVWNNTDGTLDLGLKGGNVTLQIGQEQVIRVVNKTGADLLEADFYAVRIRLVSEGGAQGQRLAVVLAQGDSDTDSATTIGLVTENIANNQEGFITTVGNVNGINTTGAKSYGGLETWADGDILYLDPSHAGYLTNVKPQAPQHMIVMGYVVYSHAINGKIFVKVDNGYELDELHNVRITTASLTPGQLLVRSGSITTGVWINTNQLTGSYGLTGSLQATSFTGSLFGTASYATQALSASWAPSGIASSTTGSFTGSFTGSLFGKIRVINIGGAWGTMYPLIGSTFNGDATVYTIQSPDYKYDVTNNQLIVSSVSGSFTGSLFGTASFATTAQTLLGSVTSASFASTASFVNTLNQNVVITGSLTVGSSSLGPSENTITLGARDNGSEGGQIGFNAPGGTYTSASMIDLYQDRLRVLRGTNAGSTSEVAWWSMHNLQMALPAYNSPTAFTGSAVAGLGVDSNGNVVTSTRTGRYGTAISGSTIGTGVTAQTIVYSQLIPANSFAAGDIVRTYFRFRKLLTNANATFNILVNTSNAVAGATTLATLTGNAVHIQMKRDFYIAQGNATTSLGTGVSANSDDVTNTQGLTVINWAVDQYLIYTVTLNTGDSGYGLGYTIEQVL